MDFSSCISLQLNLYVLLLSELIPDAFTVDIPHTAPRLIL